MRFPHRLLLPLLIAPPLVAGGPYIERVEQFEPDGDRLQKAREKIANHREIEIRRDFSFPSWHKRPPFQDQPGTLFCTGCHLPYPHTERWNRAFLNMHSQFIACGTCHFRPEGLRLTYRWLDYRTKRPAQGEFQIDRPPEKRRPRETALKITPFLGEGPALPFRDDPWSLELLKKWRSAPLEGKAALWVKIHAPLKEGGAPCDRCHREKGPLFDPKALGASEDQDFLIRHNQIAELFRRYHLDQNPKAKIRILEMLR